MCQTQAPTQHKRPPATRILMFARDCCAYGLLAAGFADLVVEADFRPWVGLPTKSLHPLLYTVILEFWLWSLNVCSADAGLVGRVMRQKRTGTSGGRGPVCSLLGWRGSLGWCVQRVGRLALRGQHGALPRWCRFAKRLLRTPVHMLVLVHPPHPPCRYDCMALVPIIQCGGGVVADCRRKPLRWAAGSHVSGRRLPKGGVAAQGRLVGESCAPRSGAVDVADQPAAAQTEGESSGKASAMCRPQMRRDHVPHVSDPLPLPTCLQGDVPACSSEAGAAGDACTHQQTLELPQWK